MLSDHRTARHRVVRFADRTGYRTILRRTNDRPMRRSAAMLEDFVDVAFPIHHMDQSRSLAFGQLGNSGFGGFQAPQPLVTLFVLNRQSVVIDCLGIRVGPAPIVLMQQTDGHAVGTRGEGRVQM
jgi:hypothetical protein